MSTITDITFTDAAVGGITAKKLNKLRDDLEVAIGSGGGGTGTGDMTKAVYDTDNNGKVDTCDSLAWGAVTGKPATFAPSAHAPTHLDNGTDSIPVATTARTGLLPVLNGDSSTFLTGAGTFGKPVSGETGNTFAYRWDTGTTAADPGAGRIRCNNAAPGSATALYADAYDNNGIAVIPLNRLKAGDNVYLYPTGNFGQLIQYQLTGASVNNGPNAWFTLPVSVVSNSGFAPGNNANIQLQLPTTPATHALTHLDNGADPIPVVTNARTGLAPILSGTAATYLNGTGAYNQVAYGNLTGVPSTFPPDSTAMLKSVYDTNGDNIVDHAALADVAPWTGITGKPSTFPPDSTAMLKSVYDTNANNVVDTCDSLAWGKLTGVPASFTPSAHASTHLAAGSDPIALATSVLAGLCPAVDNSTIQVVTSKLSCVALAWTAITGKPSTFPPDSTAMLKATYDTNGDGISDHAALADAVPWTGITGKPSTFPPDSTGMLKSVYDTNANNVVDTCDSLAWAKLTGVPATFPPDSTAMLKATYDTNTNGVVDTCDSLAWAKLTGVPATFPPDSTAMLKSVYDTNADNIVDHAALADGAPWTGITGKPATFTPSAHASTHLDNGTDPIPVATASRTGSLRALNGTATTFLDGTGNWSTPAPSGTVNPGTWTNLTYSTGWTQNTTAQYRVETNGSFQSVICQGIINYASGVAALAFTLPAGARPGVTRGCALAGFDSTGDVQLFQAVIATSGAVNIYPMVRQNFSWPSATSGSVYLDSLSFAL